MKTLDELAGEIREIVRNRIRALQTIGLEAELQKMGPDSTAYWQGGPKITVVAGNPAVRYVVRRDEAEMYLKKLRESPANFDLILENLRAFGRREHDAERRVRG